MAAHQTPRVLASLLALLFPFAASAQCPEWQPNAGLYGSAVVYASTVWDPDGAGPQAPLLVAAGNFTNVTSLEGPQRSNIAAWDGSSWQPLGSGVSTGISGWVNDLIVLNGELIAAGSFSSAGGNAISNIARWNGTTWHSLGTGINGQVHALCLPTNGGLIAGGTFTTAGGVAAANIARWNNATQTWSALGTGTNGQVSALATMPSGDIIAGGGFSTAGGGTSNRIARWNGSSWSSMNGGVLGDQNGAYIAALHVRPNGDLIAGGQFIQAGAVSTNNIARWVPGGGGVWSALGSGVFLGSPVVQAIKEFGSDLVVGGRFIVAGDFTCNNIAKWNGSSWSALQMGIPSDISNYVMTLCVHNSELFIGGSFPAYNGNNFARSTARWTGSQWLPIPGFICPRNQFVFDFETWNNKLVIAGQHTSLNTNMPNFSRHLIAWDGTNATELGNPDSAVQTLATAPGPLGTTDLLAGGSFSTIGGVSASRVAYFTALPTPHWQSMGPGFNGGVNALLRHPGDGFIYAGGFFSLSGSTSVSNIARWNAASFQWQPLAFGVNGTVNCMKVFNNVLYAGGSFTTANGLPSGTIAGYTATGWQTLGSTVTGTVRALEVFQNKLIIAGEVAGVNNSPGIMAYDGTSFTSLGIGGARLSDGTPARIWALTVRNNALYAGGTFTTIGGVQADYLAKWDGSTWSEVGNGVQDEVRCLHNFNGELQVGGDFAFVDNNTVLAPMWARYKEACYANCDCSTGTPTLTSNDFQCFLNLFASGAAHANCDASTGTPALTSNDFQCFLNKFAAGCP